MEFLGSIFGIGKDIWEATGNWFGYINNLDANMQNLKRKIEELSGQEDDINTELTSAEQQPRKRRKKVVDDWLLAVQTVKGDVQTLQRQQQEVVGWKHVFPRAQLGKLVMEKIQEVKKLQKKGTFSNGLLIDALPTCQGFIPTTASFGETTSARNKENVWNCLMDDEVRRIGVSGMGGVGKTTIMHHINNRLLKETSNFGDVIWVTVSKAFNVRNLQRVIANKLNLNISDYEDETRTASELYEMLSRKKSYVLILDDLWESFPLDKVGIPEPTRDNGCKLVLTTRSSEVCRNMECREIKVELLTEEEALNLFMSKVEGHQTVLTPKVKEIATKVAKECARLPLAIITVAGSMRGSRVNDIQEWINALNELISVTKQIRGTKSDPVFGRLKFSYSRLKDEKLQHCFLYCALYPEDHDIPREELIEYWIAEELITEMNSIEAMFAKGHTILNKLIDTCLLESVTDFHDREYVRMHDLIRDMALKITSTSPRFMVRAGEGFKRVTYEEWSEDLERVSLMFNMMNELPSRPPICPRLTTLLLRKGVSPSVWIPDSFFMHMPCLKVLDLSHNNMQSLPESIFKLENLHALSLQDCEELKYVPSLEKLKALRELKLKNIYQIEEVPDGIEELVNLRNLDLSGSNSIHTFPGWKLCKLTQLQRLRIDGTSAKVSAEELLCLTQLEVLGAQFHNVQELTSYVTSQQCQRLKNYRFIVGNDFEKQLKILGNEVCVYIDPPALSGNGVDSLVLPNSIKFFEIKRCHDLVCLSDILSLRDAKDLRTCEIRHCYGIESIISTSSFSDCKIPLRTVERLLLGAIPNFRVFFDGVVPPHNISFKLKELYFCRGPKIKNILPVNLLQNFPNLEKLSVYGCENVEDIIVDEEINDGGHRQEDRNIIILRNLKYLRLEKLPRLKNICKSIMVCESIQDIDVGHCPMLRRMPLSLHKDGEQLWSAPPALRSIRGSEEWWKSLIWDDPHTKTTLQPFFSCTFV